MIIRKFGFTVLSISVLLAGGPSFAQVADEVGKEEKPKNVKFEWPRVLDDGTIERPLPTRVLSAGIARTGAGSGHLELEAGRMIHLNAEELSRGSEYSSASGVALNPGVKASVDFEEVEGLPARQIRRRVEVDGVTIGSLYVRDKESSAKAGLIDLDFVHLRDENLDLKSDAVRAQMFMEVLGAYKVLGLPSETQASFSIGVTAGAVNSGEGGSKVTDAGIVSELELCQIAKMGRKVVRLKFCGGTDVGQLTGVAYHYGLEAERIGGSPVSAFLKKREFERLELDGIKIRKTDVGVSIKAF